MKLWICTCCIFADTVLPKVLPSVWRDSPHLSMHSPPPPSSVHPVRWGALVGHAATMPLSMPRIRRHDDHCIVLNIAVSQSHRHHDQPGTETEPIHRTCPATVPAHSPSCSVTLSKTNHSLHCTVYCSGAAPVAANGVHQHSGNSQQGVVTHAGPAGCHRCLPVLTAPYHR